MYNLFKTPIARFIAGFIVAVFVFLPMVWVLSGSVVLNVALSLAVAAVGAAGGIFWVRKPPEIFFRLPPDAHGRGIFGSPAMRFAAAFISGSGVYLLMMSVFPEPLTYFSLPPMIGVGLVCGLMAARKSASIFISRSSFPR